MGRSRVWALAAAVGLLTALSVPAAAQIEPGGTFIDDDGSVHEPSIEAMRAEGITAGCHPVGDLFCPGRGVTRAEMAAFLVRALGEEPADHRGTFSDVPDGRWYTGHVERLAALGVASGYPDGRFRPDASVSRAEMAALLVRALGEEAVEPSAAFTDVPADAWYAGFVEALSGRGITRGCGVDPLRYCPLDAVARAEMASFVARAFDLPTEPVPPRPDVQGLDLRLRTVASGFEQPVFVAAPAGDPRLFVVDQPGVIQIVRDGRVLPAPFLDISDRVRFSGEQGLLGLAFHPDFASNGRFFVHFTDLAGDTRVVEYFAPRAGDTADEATARQLLFVDQPASNHNGGMLAFGPDGLLYVALGDGGGAGDRFGHGQDPSTPLGTISRIDVDGGARSLFAYGLRNPWRFSFDGHRLYVADVGQDAREEVNVLTTFDAGSNLGWPIMEGSSCFRAASCDRSGLLLPVLDYLHPEGCSVTGGYVYRGRAIPDLRGHYLFGDFCGGWVSSFRYDGRGAADARRWPFRVDGLTSFGVDAAGEVYLTSTDGTVRMLVPG